MPYWNCQQDADAPKQGRGEIPCCLKSEKIMKKLFEGTFALKVHTGGVHPHTGAAVAAKGVTLYEPKHGNMTADMAVDVLKAAVVLAEHNKCGLDKWSFYIAGANDKLKDSDRQIPVAVAMRAIQENAKKGIPVKVVKGKFGPSVWMQPDQPEKVKAEAPKPLTLDEIFALTKGKK